jgi:hypothetical protein
LPLAGEEARQRARKAGVATATSTKGGHVRADLDALLTAIYVLVDDFLPERQGAGAPPRISDAELITLAIAQVFLGLPNDRQLLALARYRLGHLFPYLPKQPGYNKRLRRLVAQIASSIN